MLISAHERDYHRQVDSLLDGEVARDLHTGDVLILWARGRGRSPSHYVLYATGQHTGPGWEAVPSRRRYKAKADIRARAVPDAIQQAEALLRGKAVPV